MLTNFLLGLPTMVLCLMLQLLLLVVVARFFLYRQNKLNMDSLWSSIAVLKGVMLLLVIGNLGQIAIWALLFRMLGEFQQFDDAFYHSAVNFGSLGYGDIVMSRQYRLLGALEAINGVLMIGVSTAALMSTFQIATRKFRAAISERIIK
jgi:hypothetical protein